MELLIPTPAELASTLDRGAAFWRERGYGCGEDALPPEFILSAALDHPDAAFWLTPRLLVVDGHIVGTVVFKAIPADDGQIEIGYAIGAAHRGQGLATRGVNAIVAEAFRHPVISRVIAHTELDNSASIRVLEKCGFAAVSRVLTEEGDIVRKFGIRRATAAE